MKATKEMIEAGAKAARKYMEETGGNCLSVIWNAMWVARPKEPAQQQEPVREMPSDTRYAVAVEGQALTYWDNIHDAITNAQRAVYAGPDATSRAIEDLRAGRLAEWSYGFSAVRIYPPQSTSTPASKPDFKAFKEWAGAAGYDTAHTHDGIKWVCLNPMTADLWKAWQAARERCKACLHILTSTRTDNQRPRNSDPSPAKAIRRA